MRNAVLIPVLLLSAALAGSAQEQQTPVVVASPAAPPAPAPAPVKVATIFGQNAIISTQEGQKASSALTAKYQPKRDEFNRKQAEVKQLLDQLKKGQTTLSADSRARLNDAIDAKTREAKRLGEDSQDALEQEEGAMMQQLGEKLMDVIRDYATRNGYAAVIDVSLPNGPVLWASPSIDITSAIVKLYDQTHSVPGTSAPVPAAKK